jgi:hypothetical protein
MKRLAMALDRISDGAAEKTVRRLVKEFLPNLSARTRPAEDRYKL